MSLPPTFKKINIAEENDKRPTENAGSAGGKCQKKDKSDKKDQPLVIVKNPDQHKSFKMREGESWRKNFKSANIDDRPTWTGEKTSKMCLRFHILGECFESCDRKESHVPKNQIPAERVADMCRFIAKCRGE